MSEQPSTERPDVVTDEHLAFLDALRASGATNMFGAGPYVRDAFSVDLRTARAILHYWMDTFGERRPR